MALFDKQRFDRIIRNAAGSLSRHRDVKEKEVLALVNGLEHEDVVLLRIFARLRGDVWHLQNDVTGLMNRTVMVTGVLKTAIRDSVNESSELLELAEAIVRKDRSSEELLKRKIMKLEELFHEHLLELGRDRFTSQ
ncbi:MAG: hypothetical protein HY438_00225 [DPANN group archaeon]|nr:hypothetical protein [DPANN group archaeon]